MLTKPPELSKVQREGAEDLFGELGLRRARTDARWFFRNCVNIPSQRVEGGREPFELFPHQETDFEVFEREKFSIVLKARQLGLSTLVGAYSLWLAVFRPGTVILWVSNNQDNANKAVGMLKVMWEFLPQWMQDRLPELTSDQAGKMEWTFADGSKSRIRAFAGTKKAGASETATLVILDEFALVEDQDNLLRSTEPTTDAGGKLIIISTARGAYNRFAKTFRAAQRGRSRYTPIFHPWHVSAFVDEAGYEAKKRDFADKPWLFHAEYPATPEEAFMESGNPRFTGLSPIEDYDDLVWRGKISDAFGHVKLKEHDDGELRLSAEGIAPPPTHEYVLFLDPATGKGLDYTAMIVMAIDEDGVPRICGYWHANTVEAVVAAKQAALLGKHFNGALLAVEATGGWGESFLYQLQKDNYPNLYTHVAVGSRRRRAAPRYGFPMTSMRRPLVIDKLAQTLIEPGIEKVFPLLRHELGTFVRREDGTVAADVGCHDDLVMATAGALYVLHEQVTAGRMGATSGGSGEQTASSMAGTLNILEEAEKQWRRDERAVAAVQRRRHRAIRRGR